MKCNHCNTEVAEGTKFCPECGNRIEQPQPIKCPQCDTVVEEGVKFENRGSKNFVKPRMEYIEDKEKIQEIRKLLENN